MSQAVRNITLDVTSSRCIFSLMSGPPNPSRRPQSYGLTDAEYADLERRADGHCELCGKDAQKLYLDHDHDTGFVRGFLCPLCNAALGFFGRHYAKIQGYLTAAEVWRDRMAFHKYTEKVVNKRGVAFRRIAS